MLTGALEDNVGQRSIGVPFNGMYSGEPLFQGHTPMESAHKRSFGIEVVSPPPVWHRGTASISEGVRGFTKRRSIMASNG